MRLLFPEKPVLIQRKLRINTPGDRHEQEADRVADQVVRGSGPVQRQATPAGSETAGTTAPPMVQEVVSSSGRPLDPGTRGLMEERFGHDFGRVRVHDDAKASESARQIDALAYTSGSDIVFGAGRYEIGTEAGQRLLAHELTHVVQQTGGGAPTAGMIQRQPAPAADLRESASPTMASALGSTVVDKFPLGSAKIPADGESALRYIAGQILYFIQKYPASTVQITGHTDTVDSDKFNLTLGQQRADAVKAFLVKEGVPAEIISTDSQGEKSPVVPTKDGVAEPRNRRANVFFRVNKMGLSLGLDYKLEPPKPEAPKPPINLDPGQVKLPEEPEKPRDIWKEMEENQRKIDEYDRKHPKKNRSVTDVVVDGLMDNVVKPVLKKLPLPEDLRKKAESAIRDGIESGSEKACEAAIDALNVGAEQKEALKAACKAALKQKAGGKP